MLFIDDKIEKYYPEIPPLYVIVVMFILGFLAIHIVMGYFK